MLSDIISWRICSVSNSFSIPAYKIKGSFQELVRVQKTWNSFWTSCVWFEFPVYYFFTKLYHKASAIKMSFNVSWMFSFCVVSKKKKKNCPHHWTHRVKSCWLWFIHAHGSWPLYKILSRDPRYRPRAKSHTWHTTHTKFEWKSAWNLVWVVCYQPEI